MPKVTMSLTERDVANTEKIRLDLDARNNAHAVRISVSLTAFITGETRKGSEIFLRSPAGDYQKIFMDELGSR